MDHIFLSFIKGSGPHISPEIINTNNFIPDMEWRFGHELVQPGGSKELHFPLQTPHRQLRNTEMH